MSSESKKFILLLLAFLALYFIPFTDSKVGEAIIGGFEMLHSYTREHVLLCLVPAFFVAGTISVFVNKNAVLRLLGPKAKKIVAYPVAAVAGGILAVCSCTILPLFGGIYKKGAGLGPATAFLFTGPAINVAAVFLTGTVLGWELSFVRIIATVVSAVIIGIIMQALFKETGRDGFTFGSDTDISLWKTVLFLGAQMAFLITGSIKMNGFVKALIMISLAVVSVFIALSFKKSLQKRFIHETWDFTKKILPYLFVGVFVAGVISKALPENVVNVLLGGNKLFSNLFASVFGAVMYFATLTEVPIIQSLMSLGMGKGPALALFMAGYTLSLPNMIVLTRLLGKKKAFSYFALVIIFSTTWGYVYGNLF